MASQLQGGINLPKPPSLLPIGPVDGALLPLPTPFLPLKFPLALPQNCRQSHNPHPFRRPPPPLPLPHPQGHHAPPPSRQPSSLVPKAELAPLKLHPANFHFPQSPPLPAPGLYPLPPPPCGLAPPPAHAYGMAPPPAHAYGMAPPPAHAGLHAEDISSGEEGEGRAQELSHGLCEVVPAKANISIRALSPFESYPDPCQFTVPLPRLRPVESPLQPPWKNICPKEDAKGPVNGTWKSFKGDGKSGRRKFKGKLKMKPPMKSPSVTSKSLPTHFLLKNGEWDGCVDPESTANSVSDPVPAGGLPTEGVL